VTGGGLLSLPYGGSGLAAPKGWHRRACGRVYGRGKGVGAASARGRCSGRKPSLAGSVQDAQIARRGAAPFCAIFA
jgi:hypothetical protein